MKFDPPQFNLLVPGASAVLLEFVWSLWMNTGLSHMPKIMVKILLNTLTVKLYKAANYRQEDIAV